MTNMGPWSGQNNQSPPPQGWNGQQQPAQPHNQAAQPYIAAQQGMPPGTQQHPHSSVSHGGYQQGANNYYQPQQQQGYAAGAQLQPQFAGGAPSNGQVVHPAYWTQAPVGQPSKRPVSGNKVINIIVLSLAALVLIGTLLFFALALGASVFLICGTLALIPLAICVLVLLWIDRWEPEPKTALLFAFCWGAGMSVVTTLVLGSWISPILEAGNSSTDPDTLGAVIQAPLVEEFCKGLGLLLIFFLRRKTFDGPIDGVVYAGIIASGFAFTENILYFNKAYQSDEYGVSNLIQIFILRGLMSPFAHVMFTAALGAIVGYAARYGDTGMVIVAWLVGLIPAMFLHGLWNGMTLMTGSFWMGYLLLQVPLFLLAIVGVILLRRSEAKLTRLRLADYVPSGWFSPQEIPMLATGSGRRRALSWSRTFSSGPIMKQFIQLATRLAFTRQRILVDANAHPGTSRAIRLQKAQQQESRLLNRATATRAELLSRHQNLAWNRQAAWNAAHHQQFTAPHVPVGQTSQFQQPNQNYQQGPRY